MKIQIASGISWLLFAVIGSGVFGAGTGIAQEKYKRNPVGVVSHVKVVSDKVPDVSSLDAWKAALLKDGMTDQEKALAVWRTVVMFQHQDVPCREFLQHEESVQDPIKIFNVYGYSFCSVDARQNGQSGTWTVKIYFGR